MFVIRILAIIALLASITNAYVGARISKSSNVQQRRLFVYVHISSGIVLCVSSALLAFWAFTAD
jgi:uncharacterized membrane protein YfcA